ncbi:hypothetical protein TREPR_3048 [Treponema primitia ZAS-2]|uniref:Uncharacterized protein n=1 Tax=Treponema primitia (strain ATCC BAA-887 / DSM 12427 / ZAS-2) TaxID=545694 RepID=F5YMQ6_TREPZ|nr:hypothetical protein [Treponema primitia]AEF86079.1 hypothetical protein TREPR_3048 [Treponema primitia ZAS-2]
MLYIMIIVGIIVSLAMLVVIIRFALSKKTEKLVRLASIIALGLIVLAIVFCLIMIAAGPKEVEEEVAFTALPPSTPVAVTNTGAVYFLIFGIVVVLFLGFIIFTAMRDQKKGKKSL